MRDQLTRCTNAEMTQRVGFVADLILRGERKATIAAISLQKWGVKESSVEEYITLAHKEIQEVNRASLEENRAWVLQNLKDTFKRALDANNLNIQLGALSQFSKVAGVEIAPKDNPAEPLKDVDLEQIEKEVSESLSVVH